MKITVKVKAGSKEEKVTPASDGGFILHVKAPAKEGKANKAVIELLSRHFNIPKNSIAMLRGFKGKIKVVDLKTFS